MDKISVKDIWTRSIIQPKPYSSRHRLIINNRLTDQRSKAIHIPSSSSLESYYLMNTAQTEKINSEVCENNLSTESLSSASASLADLNVLQQLDPSHPTNIESNVTTANTTTTTTTENAQISSVHGDTKIMNLDNKQIEILSNCLLSTLSIKDLLNMLPKNKLFTQETSDTTPNNTTISNSSTSNTSKDKTASSSSPHSGAYSTTINGKSSKLTTSLKNVKDKKLLTAVNSYRMNIEELNIGSKMYKDNKDLGSSLGTDIRCAGTSSTSNSCSGSCGDATNSADDSMRQLEDARITLNKPTDDGYQEGGEKKHSKADEGGMMRPALPGSLTLGVNDLKQCRSTSCIVKFMYLGISRTEEAKIQQTTIDDQQKTPKGKVSSAKEDNQYLSRVITVIQQPNGGKTLTVFKDSLQPGDIFQIVSRRAYGFPFSLTFYVDGTQDTRISACCEYRHRQGVRIGGRNGHFVYLTVEGSFPCYRCQTAKAMKRELKAKKLAKKSAIHRDKEEKRFEGGEKEGQREEDGEDNESDVDDNEGDSKDKQYNTLDVDIDNCTNEKLTPTHRLSTTLSPPEADYMTNIIVNSLDSDSQSIIIDRIAESDRRHNKAETCLNKQTYDQHKNARENDPLDKQLCHVDLSNIQICDEQNKFEVIQQDSLSDKCDSVTLNNTLSERSKCEAVDRSIKKDEIHKDFNISKISDSLHMNEFNKKVEEYADRDDENGDQSGDDDDDDTGECVDNSTGNCQPTDDKYSKLNKLTCIKNKCKEKLKSIKVVPRQKLSKWNQCMNINASSIPGDHYSQFLSKNFDIIDPEGSDTQEVTSKTNLTHDENEDDDDREESFTTVSLDKEMKTIEHRNADDLFKMNLIKQLNEIDKESIFHKTIPSSANLNLKSEQGGQEKFTSITTDKINFSDLFNKQASHDINSSLCSLENRIPKIIIQSPSCSNNSVECYEDTSCMSNAKQIDNDDADIDDEMEVGDDDDDDISSNYDDDEKTNEGDDFNTFTYDDDEDEDDEDTSQLSVIYRPLVNQSTLNQSTVHPVTTTNKPIPMNSNTYFNSLDTNIYEDDFEIENGIDNIIIDKVIEEVEEDSVEVLHPSGVNQVLISTKVDEIPSTGE
ncbi:unnamed protein product [Trichobilharzia szidati]|nr:unnamed protein product [Trichobilharzia szidati]